MKSYANMKFITINNIIQPHHILVSSLKYDLKDVLVNSLKSHNTNKFAYMMVRFQFHGILYRAW